MKENFADILLYSTNPHIIEKQSELLKKENKTLNILKAENKEGLIDQTTNKEIDLIVFNMDKNIESNISHIKELQNNNSLKELFILFIIDIKNLERVLKSDMDLLRVDYLVDPVPEKVLIHKISLLIQNILQKKATEYLVDAYDQNVIASKTDKKGLITYSSKAFCDICEYSADELIGKSHNIVRHPDIPKELYKDLWESIKKGESWRGELKNKTKSGGFYWVDVVITPDLDYKGDILGYTSIRQDITSKKYIEQITITDHLTKVYNKKFFDESLEKEIYSAKRYNYPLNLIILDIDHFKKINDTFGHAIGDSVLKEFSSILRDNSRKSDIISRIGGEEFTIIVSNDNIQSIYNFASKIRALIEKYPFKKVGKLTTSIGVAELSNEDTQDSFFEKADSALYKAKNNGRNRVMVY